MLLPLGLLVDDPVAVVAHLTRFLRSEGEHGNLFFRWLERAIQATYRPVLHRAIEAALRPSG